jgi:hypothetical protein
VVIELLMRVDRIVDVSLGVNTHFYDIIVDVCLCRSGRVLAPKWHFCQRVFEWRRTFVNTFVNTPFLTGGYPVGATGGGGSFDESPLTNVPQNRP